MAKRLKGLYRDCEPIDQPPETYRYANNALLSEQVGSIMSDYGLSKINVSAALGQDFIILGHVSINKGRVVIFSVNNNGTGSKISVISPDSSIDVISTGVDFSFSTTSEIDATFRIDKDLNAVVYFTDGINPPRFVNIDSFIVYPEINRYNIFNHVEKLAGSFLDLSVSNSGGSLTSGAYYFSFRYIDKDGNKTNFLTLTNPVYIYEDPINDSNADGCPAGTPTSKSILFKLFDLDPYYVSVEVAVIKKSGGTFESVKILPPLNIKEEGFAVPSNSESPSYSYTGNESYTEGSLDEILINNSSYKTAKTIEESNGVLYLGNLTKGKDIGYQKYANNIQLETIREDKDDFNRSLDYTDSSGNLILSNPRYKDPIISFNDKGYQRDEVYAFYISFILNDGSESKAYHIPGRPPKDFTETSFVTSQINYINNEYGPQTANRILDIDNYGSRVFHFDNSHHPTLNTGYWENANERYPDTDDWDVWSVNSDGDGVKLTGNTLRNQPVRHHRMPDHRRRPIIKTSDYMKEAFILKIRLKNIRIPNEILEQVKSFKVYYAKPSTSNKRVIDQAFIWKLFQNNDSLITGNDELHYVSLLPKTTAESYNVNNSFLSSRGLACMPFYLMKNKENISSLNYLLKIYVPKNSRRNLVTTNTGFYDFASHPDETSLSPANYLNDIKDPNTINFGYNNNEADGSAIIGIKSKAYVPHAQNVVELKSKGFKYNMTTINSESQIVMESSHDIEKILWNSPQSREFSFICNLMSYKRELYNSFDNQELVWTGYTSPFVDNIINTTPIGGGDIFLCKYSMRCSGLDIKNNSTTVPLHKMVFSQFVESRDNVELRHQGSEYYEIYHPKSSFTELLNIEENEANLENNSPVDFFDNYYGYNIDYRALQDIKTTIPYEKNQRFQSTSFPTRVIRSQKVMPGSSSDFFRTFLENDFKDFGYNRGDLVKINKYANNLILHMERAIMITRGREELATGDFRAFLGAGDIFAVEPNELLMSEDGTGGLQNQHHSLLTEEGYFFVDQEEGSIYSLTSNGLANISDIGMRNEFEKIIPWNLSEYSSNFNPYITNKKYIGINFGYDKEHGRLFFVKRDLKPKQAFINAYNSNNVTINKSGNLSIYGTPTDYEPNIYFTADNVCLSYVPQLNAWVSYHTYAPQYYVSLLNSLYGLFLGGLVYKYNDKSLPVKKSDEADDLSFEFGFVENREPSETKVFYSLSLITSVKNPEGIENRNETFTTFRFFTSRQDSGDVSIDIFQSLSNQGNTRNINGSWVTNKIRTINSDWRKKDRFIDKYVEVLLKYSITNYNNFLYLTSSEVGVKKTIR